MNVMERDPKIDAWIADAKAVSVIKAAEMVGFKLNHPTAPSGPCPLCGGENRFAVSARKGMWICRGGGSGRDPISLVRHVMNLKFLDAVEFLVGAKPEGTYRPSAAAAEARGRVDFYEGVTQSPWKDAADLDLDAAWRKGWGEAKAKDDNAAAWREKERRRAWQIWRSGTEIFGTPVEVYLRSRGLGPLLDSGVTIRLRALADLDYYTPTGASQSVRVGSAPAMLAAGVAPDGTFSAVHITYLSRLGTAKALFKHPLTGEALPAKKLRGIGHGIHLPLIGAVGDTPIGTRFIGEGIETVLSAAQAVMRETNFSDMAFWSAYSLGNLGGKALGSVDHPSERITVQVMKGKNAGTSYTRARRVLSDQPDLNDQTPVIPMRQAQKIIILGDGDSEPFATANALRRAKARWHREDRPALIKTATAGKDFNDVLRGEA